VLVRRARERERVGKGRGPRRVAALHRPRAQEALALRRVHLTNHLGVPRRPENVGLHPRKRVGPQGAGRLVLRGKEATAGGALKSAVKQVHGRGVLQIVAGIAQQGLPIVGRREGGGGRGGLR